ncbi:MAG: acetoacetate decarboxylase family protein [Chromatiales bacterium]|nr:acetoacetate decarboxylase family protein [Chromatiales bacterium]MDH4030020.1 acetoacetate decarboxylase family protein [Chromatiales bacterium]
MSQSHTDPLQPTANRLTEVPDHRIVPAPWRLAGSGLIIVTRPDSSDPSLHRFTQDELRPHALAGLSVTMFVDYWRSDAGPYRELLFIPCRFRIGGARRWSISRIFVSTPESVVGGRANWGIPKQIAAFEVEGAAGGRQSVTVSRDDGLVAALEFEPVGPEIPVTTALLPSRLLRLAQYRDGKTFEFAPAARGRMRLARLLAADSDPQAFPLPGSGRVLGAFSVTSFEMQFPASRVIKGLP